MNYNMSDNINFMNLQSRIYDMHNIMRQINVEGEQVNEPLGNGQGQKGGFPLTRSLLENPYNAAGSSSITRNTLTNNNYNPQRGNSLLGLSNEAG